MLALLQAHERAKNAAGLQKSGQVSTWVATEVIRQFRVTCGAVHASCSSQRP